MEIWERVECTKCGQPAGKRCKSLTSNKTTDTHNARYDAEIPSAYTKEEDL